MDKHFTIGTPVTQRPPNMSNTIGLFVNTVLVKNIDGFENLQKVAVFFQRYLIISKL